MDEHYFDKGVLKKEQLDYMEKIVMKYFISKQKVKEVLDKFAEYSDVDGRRVMYEFSKTDLRELRKSLGVE